MPCVHGCLYTTCVPETHRSQKRISDSLEIKLQMFVKWHMGPGNLIQLSTRAEFTLKHCAISPALLPLGCNTRIQIYAWILYFIHLCMSYESVARSYSCPHHYFWQWLFFILHFHPHILKGLNFPHSYQVFTDFIFC